MDKENIRRFIKTLQPNAEIVDNGEWQNASCPLARWTHARGTDSNPSFGIHVATPSTFHCWGCGLAGPLPRLIELLEEKSGDDYSSLSAQIGLHELIAPTLHTDWDHAGDLRGDEVLGDPPPVEVLGWYDEAAGDPYLAERGILDETAEDLGLVIDPDNRGARRILFPVYTHTGVFYGFTGRATDRQVTPKVRDYHGLDKRLLLLGSHLCGTGDDGGGRIVLVEGLFDYATVAQRGHPVVASMGANLSVPQAEILIELAQPVVIFYDNDDAGSTGRRKAAALLRGHIPVLGVNYGQGQIGFDPGKLTDYEIDKMVDNAKLL